MQKKLSGLECCLAVGEFFRIAPDAIIVTGKNNEVVHMNPKAIEMFGYSLEEALGRNVHELLAPPEFFEVYEEGFRRYMETGEGAAFGKTLELCAIRKNGERFSMELSLSELPSRAGAIGIIRDITERKKREKESAEMQERILRMEVLESIGVIFNGVLHDLNNILTFVLGFASLIAVFENAPDKVRLYAEKIVKGVERATALSRSLLRTVKGGDVMSPVDINEVADEICSLLLSEAHKNGVVICKKLQPVSLIQGSYCQLTSVILNMLVNSLHAMKKTEVKELVVSTQDVFLEKSSNVERAGTYVELCISDTGCGIPEEIKEKIFEDFFTTKKGDGSGVGLAIALKFVKRHGGIIKLESQVGRGTNFKIYFPCLVPEDIKRNF